MKTFCFSREWLTNYLLLEHIWSNLWFLLQGFAIAYYHDYVPELNNEKLKMAAATDVSFNMIRLTSLYILFRFDSVITQLDYKNYQTTEAML